MQCPSARIVAIPWIWTCCVVSLACFKYTIAGQNPAVPSVHDLQVSPQRSTLNAQRLTRDGNFKQHPAWSPDGKLLAFTVYLKGKVGLVQLASGSTEWKHITPLDDNPEYEPSWSPDGKQIVFVSDSLQGTDGQLQIHRINAYGSESKRIVEPAKRPAQDEHPAWSPDAKTI